MLGAFTPLFWIFMFIIIIAAKKENDKAKQRKQEFFDQIDQEFVIDEEHINSRDHRIWEQEQKVTQYSEKTPVVEFRKPKRAERTPIKKPSARESDKHYQKPKRVVKETMFQDPKEIQKAFIYSEIFGKPKALRK